MRVIAVASQKGGSGKTTLSGHLAVQAELTGDGPVALIDVDPQGSLAAWWNERQAEAPVFARTSLADLREDLDKLREAGIKLVVIDTPPAITTAIHEVISVADFVIVPTRPSPHDLRAVGATVSLVQRCNKPLCFVVNAATPRARITSEAAIALSQYGTVAPITIHQRTDFASCMIDGRTVMELKAEGRSALEIQGLWEYLHARLEDEVSPAVFHIHQEAQIETARLSMPTPQDRAERAERRESQSALIDMPVPMPTVTPGPIQAAVPTPMTASFSQPKAVQVDAEDEAGLYGGDPGVLEALSALEAFASRAAAASVTDASSDSDASDVFSWSSLRPQAPQAAPVNAAPRVIPNVSSAVRSFGRRTS